MSLSGKVALITGMGGAQGSAAARRFAAAGATVVGCDVNAEACQAVVSEIEAAGGAISAQAPVDLGNPDQAKAWIDAAFAAHGRIDILYNNASAARFAPIEHFSVDDWRFTVSNELDLVFYASKFAWDYLKRQGGVILNTASVAGSTGFGGAGAAHCACKAGVVGLTRALAVEGAPHNIRVVSISPGPIAVPTTKAMMEEHPGLADRVTDRTLLKRWGKPEEIAGLALFVVGDEASFITGANYLVDGGMMAT